MSARSIKKTRHNFLAEGLINLPNSGAPFFSSRWTLEFLECGNGVNQRRPKASHRPIPSHATPAETHANKSKIILNNIHCLGICNATYQKDVCELVVTANKAESLK
jgi:hypothetical protein